MPKPEKLTPPGAGLAMNLVKLAEQMKAARTTTKPEKDSGLLILMDDGSFGIAYPERE